WLALTCDAIDFFSVSLSVVRLQEQFGKDTHTIVSVIISVSLIFGVASDRFGRKWPLVVNLVIVGVLELAAGFVNTFPQFLALRSLFGIGMGGGLASSTALENLPVEARGIASGFLQQGYAMVYLLAACINLKLVPAAPDGWRALFWTASGITFFVAVIRAIVPESEVFLKAKEEERRNGDMRTTSEKSRIFAKELGAMLKKHWMLCIYAVLLMSGFNFLSHGSQDLYPTYLQTSKNFTPHDSTIATIIGNCGAITGGVIAGMVSQHIGRRLTIVIFVCLVGAFIPLWILPSSFGALSAGAFCLQIGVQGAWGVIPIQLAEMSPPAFRATFPGVAYQIGNVRSTLSPGGDNLKTTIIKNGEPTIVPDYAKVQGIFVGCVATFVIFITIIGPENHGSHFEKSRAAFEEGAGREGMRDENTPPAKDSERESSSVSEQELNEKRQSSEKVETV
ncbi:carboxylic acid transporter, partial [Coprinopsis sp. MPI-PUGE-AT-0042]